LTRFVSATVWHSRAGFQSFPPARRLRADEAIRSMLAAWDESGETAPPATFIAGMAGTGKTTFLDQFIERAPGRKPLRVSGEEMSLADLASGEHLLASTAARTAGTGDCVVVDALDQASWPTGSEGEVVAAIERAVEALERSAREHRYWPIASVRTEFLLRYQMLRTWLEEPAASRVYLTMGRWTLEDALQLVGAGNAEPGRRQFLEKIWEPGRSGPARVEWYERPLFLHLLEQLPADQLAPVTSSLSDADTEPIYRLYKLVFANEPEWANKAIGEELAQRRVLRPNRPLTLPVPPALKEAGKDIAPSRVLRQVASHLEFIHRTFGEFVTAREISLRYVRGDRETFADYFFHWDTRFFLIYAMDEAGAGGYKSALRTAIGLNEHEPPEIEWSFAIYSRMIMQPYALNEQDLSDLSTLAEKIELGSRERLNQRFLAYVLYDLRIFLEVRSLEISSHVRQPLERLVAWIGQKFGEPGPEEPKLKEQFGQAAQALLPK
jgi:hypothetical protein